MEYNLGTYRVVDYTVTVFSCSLSCLIRSVFLSQVLYYSAHILYMYCYTEHIHNTIVL